MGRGTPSPAPDPARGSLFDGMDEIPVCDEDDTDHSRAPWDNRPRPGRVDGDPMCINLYCPSAFSCRRFSQVPYQGGPATIYIDPTPTLLNGLLCEDFDPDCPQPSRET